VGAVHEIPKEFQRMMRSPVLLIHGDDDRNVSFAQTELLVDALRKQTADFEELIFPDEIREFLLHRD
jgi:dipeptidyl aminopeptidase/acylaminoacyl peptidase